MYSDCIEVEAKFKCLDFEQLRKLCKIYKFRKQGTVKEKDDYYTDKEKIFIKDRVCLRFRNRDGQREFTYKGKSESNSHRFIKNEYNIQINDVEYKEKVNFLESLGFYKYVTVIKKRETYTKIDEFCMKNVVIDDVEKVGKFVEFEVIINNRTKFNKTEMKDILNRFIHDFRKVGLEKADLPYRDYVVEKI